MHPATRGKAPTPMANLIIACLQVDPERRPDAEMIMSTFFRDQPPVLTEDIVKEFEFLLSD
jgi:hypothetical protein